MIRYNPIHMINEEIQELVMSNQLLIDQRAISIAEILFEDRIDKHNIIKNAAYWITIGLLMHTQSIRLQDENLFNEELTLIKPQLSDG